MPCHARMLDSISGSGHQWRGCYSPAHCMDWCSVTEAPYARCPERRGGQYTKSRARDSHRVGACMDGVFSRYASPTSCDVTGRRERRAHVDQLFGSPRGSSCADSRSPAGATGRRKSLRQQVTRPSFDPRLCRLLRDQGCLIQMHVHPARTRIHTFEIGLTK